MSVFYDAFSLEEGRDFVVSFMRGLSESLVVVPFITTAALKRMCEADSVGKVDNVLLEWWLALTLVKAGVGRVKAVLPVFAGTVRVGGDIVNCTSSSPRHSRSPRSTPAPSRPLATCLLSSTS